jgi:transposase
MGRALSTYQMSLPLNIECRIPANDSVRLLRHFIGGLDLRELHKTYSRIEK